MSILNYVQSFLFPKQSPFVKYAILRFSIIGLVGDKPIFDSFYSTRFMFLKIFQSTNLVLNYFINFLLLLFTLNLFASSSTNPSTFQSISPWSIKPNDPNTFIFTISPIFKGTSHNSTISNGSSSPCYKYIELKNEFLHIVVFWDLLTTNFPMSVGNIHN